VRAVCSGKGEYTLKKTYFAGVPFFGTHFLELAHWLIGIQKGYKRCGKSASVTEC